MFFKVDVEGFEVLVFFGVVEILKKFKLIIIVELFDYFLKKVGLSSFEFVGLFECFGYIVMDIEFFNVKVGIRDGNIVCCLW